MKVQIPSNRLTAFALTAIITVLSATANHADDSLLISFQGRLTDDGDQPVTGTPAMTFTIYTAGGTSIWSEAHPTVTVTDGLFSVLLGSQAALPDSVFNGEDRYLGIRVDADDELSPRTLLTSAPGATYARQLVGDIVTGPGMLRVKDSVGSSAVVLAADPGGHAMRLHPPDPCVPPDPCAPALEMLAEVDTHILRIHPPEPCVPPEPCGPAFELIADAEVHSMKVFPPDPCTSPPCTPAARIRAGSQEVDFDFMVNTPTDDEVTPISMGSNWSPDSSIGILKIAALAAAGEDYYEESPWSIVVDRDSTSMTFSRTDPTGGTNPKVNILATSSASTLTIRGEDPISDAQSIAMVAGPDGAKVGIGTDSLVEALTVMGNGWFSGDVFIYTVTRAKRNIVPIYSALDKVSRMNGYYYDCRTDEHPNFRMPEDRQIGFLAEEVNEVVPEAVGENEYGLTGVSYSRITALLVEAVKELKADNEELRSRVEALEGR